MNWLTGALRDLLLSARRLRQSPVFTIFAIASLALGIGAATAAYSAMYALVLRPRGFDESGLVVVNRTNSISSNFPASISWPDYLDLAAAARSFDRITAWTSLRGVVLTSGDGASLVQAEAVAGSYFETLGARPALGRLIQPADDRPEASSVIVLSDSTWRAQFAANPSVVGTTVKLAGQAVEIVGVAPAGFRGVTSILVSQNAGWVPLSFLRRLDNRFHAFRPADRGRASLTVAGRLRSGATVLSAAVEMTTIGQGLNAAVPLPQVNIPSAPGQTIQPVRAWAVVPTSETTAVAAAEAGRVVTMLPALVLLVACTNLTNLVLSRGATRRQEMSVRGALGASRWRLIREELGETALIAGAGALLGALVAHGLLTWTVATLQEPMTSLAPGLQVAWRLEPVVFVSAGAAAAIAMLVAGLLPALQLTRRVPARGLSLDAGTSALRWRGRSNLIALQVGVSVTLFLLVVIGVRFLITPPNGGRAAATHLGEGLDGVAVATVPFGSQNYPESRTREALAKIAEDLGRVPGIEAVALADRVPGLPNLSATYSASSAEYTSGPLFAYFTEPGQPVVSRGPGVDSDSATPSTTTFRVTPGLFSALGLRAERGRVFTDADGSGRPVVVLNRALATRVFGDADPTGRRVMMLIDRAREGTAATAASPPVEATVVGVLAPSAIDLPSGAAGRVPTFAYVPFAQQYSSTMTIVVRASDGDARPLVAAIASAVRRADPELAILNAGRADVMARGPLTFLRYLVTVGMGLATLALVLAMAGLYGVLSHVVTRRMREMGLRIALGAEPGRILRLVFRSGFRPVLEGLFIGFGCAWTIRMIVQASFTGTLSGIDATLVVAAAAPLLVAASIACYLPARRAARVDPNVALRDL